ncbi:MAG: APC family permease [Gammaproteobacteria bacterium]|nr:APC family permease [Gammaproteobacteria bacterium]MDH4315719.1 APC family permease [Gammaproteobacteria bacterium]MDH5213447.1 APC family permease [Gammaproteobacteria bacterium]MDH5499725.1 APC family permease [Gammaproteobacteria bacterium]
MSEGKLLRVVRRKEVFALAFGAMIGWSWVALSGHWIANAGSLGAMLAFMVGGVAVIFVGFTYAELAAAMPLAGGEHVYSHRALGHSAAFVCTWSILLGYASVVAFEAVALPTVIEYLVPGIARGHLWTVAGWDVKLTWVLTGVIAAVLMTAVNILGIKPAARLQLLVTVVILIAGLALAGGSLLEGSASNMQPLFNHGAKGLLGVLVMVPFMFVGFDVIPQSAEEVDMPFREIGTTLMLSIIMAVIWYAIIIWAVSSGLDEAQRNASSLPTADAAVAVLGGTWAGKLLVIGGIGGILTSWNAFLIGGSRAIYAMAKAGQLPATFGRLHSRYNTPYNAILLIGSMSVIAPLFGRPAMVWLVDAGGLGIVVAYTFVALSFIVLRRREPDMERPYSVRYWRFTGFTALILSLAIAALYLPFSPAALVWPWEWGIVAGWALLGGVLLAFGRHTAD